MAKHAKSVIQGSDILTARGRSVGCDEAPEVNGDRWYVVSWPEHVISQKFNSDADYSEFESEAEAREYAGGA